MSNPKEPGHGHPPQGPYPPQGHYPPSPTPRGPLPPGYPDVPGGHAGWAPPPKNSGRIGLIVAIVVLALLIVTGATLYFTGMFERWFGKAPAAVTAPAPAPISGPTPVAGQGPTTVPANGQHLVGTWGPNCPGSRANSATLNADGTSIDPSGTYGVWSIDSASTVTVTSNGVTRAARWEMQADGAALVRPVNGGSPTLVRRCA